MDAIEQIRDFQKNTIGSHANKHVHLPMPAPADTLAMDDSHAGFRDVLEGVAGKSPRFLQGPKTTRKTLNRLRRCLTNGEAFEGEDINYKKDGSEFWIDWYIEPLRGPDDEINYWVAVQRDMTEKRQLMAQLLQAQRLEGIGLLASGIAHDLNNVLAPVLMGCEFCARKSRPTMRANSSASSKARPNAAPDSLGKFFPSAAGSAARAARSIRATSCTKSRKWRGPLFRNESK
jgi:hypothetical protein